MVAIPSLLFRVASITYFESGSKFGDEAHHQNLGHEREVDYTAEISKQAGYFLTIFVNDTYHNIVSFKHFFCEFLYVEK